MTNAHEQFQRLLAQIEREAYARGWNAAIAALQEKAPEPVTADEYIDGKLVTIGASTMTTGSRIIERGPGRPSSAIALVRDAIAEKPGMKGVEIVQYLKQKGTPILERTIRSCLRRLKGKDADKRRMRWYPRLEQEALPMAAE